MTQLLPSLTVHLKKGRERSVIQGNPWIFSGSIARASGDTTIPGTPCAVFAASGAPLGYGYYNSSSAITVRMLTRTDEPYSARSLRSAILHAVALRSDLLSEDTDSCRLINSEGDFLPGLIVDKYGSGCVLQILTAGMEQMREAVIEALVNVCSPAFIYERSDTDSRIREGIGESEGCRYGVVPENLVVRENGLRFTVDVARGQKTGYFFDQRGNRRLLRGYAADRKVCDCFSYNGPFTLNALAGGARSVTAIDQSAPALDLLQRNLKENDFTPDRLEVRNADAFRYLREMNGQFDCIILDPPKFARHPGEVERASRGYKDINLLACRKVAPGGVIFTFSCSHAVDVKLFRQIVFAAAADSGRRFQLLHQLTAGTDHPVNLAHREGEYLKGLVLRAETP
jgi:23S rRNA (cytosine1962-C5)-methyltransferase